MTRGRAILSALAVAGALSPAERIAPAYATLSVWSERVAVTVRAALR